MDLVWTYNSVIVLICHHQDKKIILNNNFVNISLKNEFNYTNTRLGRKGVHIYTFTQGSIANAIIRIKQTNKHS